ncbi:MAG: hypothetical protein ACOZJX_04900 [Pseudomonadota bacterium]
MKLAGRTLAWWAAGATLAVAFGLWLASATEWATREVWQPAKGEAATDRHFLAKQLFGRLGATVQEQRGLATLPPEGATMLLQAYHWRFLAGRSAALRAWVERGGHLVVYYDVGDDEAFEKWLKVEYRDEPRPRRPAGASAPASAGVPEDGPADEDAMEEADEAEDEDDAPPCPSVAEPEGRPGWYGPARRFEACSHGGALLKTGRPLEWSVSDRTGLRALRLKAGLGTVSLSTGWSMPQRDTLLDDDEAILLAALVQLRPGQRIWLVVDEESPGIVATLWQQAPAAMVLTLLALALLLWRWGTRFAPLQADTVLARRSMAEQVRGTAAYLLRHSPAALHRAQWRALTEAAQAHLQGWQRLPASQRTAELARQAGLPPTELERACDPTTARDPATTGRALALMEAARRRIAEVPVPPAPPAPPSTLPSPDSTP